MASRDLATNRPLHVLVVDDSADFRSAACAFLQSTPGVQVVGEAGDGDEAVAQAERLRPDLVLMDVRMVPCNGIEAAKRMKSLLPRPEVVLFSLHADEYLRRAAIAAGAQELFSKSDFVQRVGETLARMAQCEAERNEETPMLPPPSPDPEGAVDPCREFEWTEPSPPPYPGGEVLAPELTIEHRLRRAERVEALAGLAADLAHGFNDVLQAILANAAMAQRVLGANARASANLAEIQAAGERAAALMKELLAFGWQQSQPLREVDLAALLRESLQQLRAGLPVEIELKATIGDRLPRVRAHAPQIHQLVQHLCANAAQALRDVPGGSGKWIHVRLEPCEPTPERPSAPPSVLRSGPCVLLAVSDNGAGMDAATRARVFEPFFSARTPDRGAGLGLSLVQGIVTALDGAITIHSEPGVGTTCHVYLPAATQARAALTPHPAVQ